MTIAHDAPAGMSRRHRVLVFGGLMLAGLMSSLDATVLGTALPTIVGDLGGLDRLAWVSTAYVLATSVTVPLSGRLGDLFGRRPAPEFEDWLRHQHLMDRTRRIRPRDLPARFRNLLASA